MTDQEINRHNLEQYRIAAAALAKCLFPKYNEDERIHCNRARNIIARLVAAGVKGQADDAALSGGTGSV